MVDFLEYGARLVDEMSGPSKDANKSLTDLTSTLGKAKKDLASYQAQLSKAKALGDIEGYRKYTTLVEGARSKTFTLTQELEKMGPAVDTNAGSMSQLVEQLGAVAGPMLAVAGAALAVVAGFAALTVAGAHLAIEQVELKDELETTFGALAGGPEAGRQTLAMLDELSDVLPQTREKLADWTKQYQALGITDLAGVRYQLQATASAQAIMGETGSEAYMSLTKRVQEAIETHHGLKIADKGLADLSKTGANVADVAAKMGVTSEALRNQLKAGTVDAQKFGDALSEALIEKGKGPLENMQGDLSTMTAKAHEHFVKLFDGADPKPFTSQLQSLTRVLDEGQPSAKALKWAITSFFDETFAIAGKVVPVVKHLFLEIEIGALRTYIAAKPLIRTFNELTGSVDGWKMLDVYLRSSVGFMVAMLTASIKFAEVLKEIVNLNLQVASFGTLGERVGAGYSSGLKKGKASADDAATEIASGTIKSMSKKLEVHSPSRATERIGEMTALGLGRGLENSNAPARGGSRAAENVVGATALGIASSGASGADSGAGGGRQLIVYVGGIHVDGGSAAGGSALDLTEVAVARLFERLALQEGLG